MSERDLQQCLSQFYTEKSLSAKQASRLSALASVQVRGAGGGASRPRWLAFFGSLGVCVAATAVITAYVVSPEGEQQRPAVDAVQIDSPFFDRPKNVGRSETAPRLVAVNFRADWCPACPRMVPVYDQLMKCYGDRSVLFVVFDVTNETSTKQAEYLAATLGIEWLCREPMKTGMIKLVDRQACTVLASATNPDQLEEIMATLDRGLQ